MTVGELDKIPDPRPRALTVSMKDFLALVERVAKLEEEKAKRGRPPKQEE